MLARKVRDDAREPGRAEGKWGVKSRGVCEKSIHTEWILWGLGTEHE